MAMMLINGIKMFVSDLGEGPILVLIHGAGASHKMWSYQISDFLKSGYRVINYDIRGHGLSSDSEELYNIDNLAYDLKEILAHLKINEQVNLCGLSLGGLIAQRFAVLYPSKVSKIILANTYCKLSKSHISRVVKIDEELINFANLNVEWFYEKFSIEEFSYTNYLKYISDTSNILFEDEKDKRLFSFDFMSHSNFEFISKIKSATGIFDNSSDLSKIICPTLIISSKNDISTPVDYALELHKGIKQSKLVIFEDSNHLSCIDSYKEFNYEVIEFLNYEIKE